MENPLEVVSNYLGVFLHNDIQKYQDQAICLAISHCSPHNYSKILNIISDQPYISEKKWSMYTANLITGNVELVLEYKNPNYQNNCVINIAVHCNNSAHITMNLINAKKFGKFLRKSENKNVFFPILISIDKEKLSHCVALIFDLKEKKAYMVDPNGNNNYFSVHFGRETESLIDKMILMYIEHANALTNIKIEYVPQHIWNKTTYIINRSLNNDLVLIGGNCVTLTFLIMHLLHLSDCTINYVFSMLNMLTDDELSIIINTYNGNILRLIEKENDYLKIFHLDLLGTD